MTTLYAQPNTAHRASKPVPRAISSVSFIPERERPARGRPIVSAGVGCIGLRPGNYSTRFCALRHVHIYICRTAGSANAEKSISPTRMGTQDVIDLRVDRFGCFARTDFCLHQTAIRMFSRPVTDLTQSAQYYIYSRMLLPRARDCRRNLQQR